MRMISVFYVILLFSCGAGAGDVNGLSGISSNETGGTGNHLNNVITVNYDKEIGLINNKIYGNNFRGKDPAFTRPYSASCCGNGVWDPETNTPDQQVMDFAKDAGISIVRYYMGHDWFWQHAIGENRSCRWFEWPKDMWASQCLDFGIHEFMKIIDTIGAEAVFTVSPAIPATDYNGDPAIIKDYLGKPLNINRINAVDEALNLLEYLDSPNDGSNPLGRTNWASVRAENGHPDPFSVKYFSVGNEMWVYYDQENGFPEGFRDYITDYLALYSAMKDFDNEYLHIGLQIGPTLFLDTNHAHYTQMEIQKLIGNNFDYLDVHIYHRPSRFLDPGMTIEDGYAISLSMPELWTQPMFKRLKGLFDEDGDKNVQFAVTEYNAHSVDDDKPWEQLGAALLNAELLKLFMKPENKVLMANHWTLGPRGSAFSMVREGYAPGHVTYVARPNYYVYQLYQHHFGEILIDNEVTGDTYDISGYKSYLDFLEKSIGVQDTKVPYLSVNTSKNTDGTKLYMMVINRNLKEPVTSRIDLRGIPSEWSNVFLNGGTRRIDIWVLNGPSIDATNEERSDNVGVAHKEIEITGSPFELILEPHSLTAIEITSII
jgi:alpha-N-arabinofuranosidase